MEPNELDTQVLFEVMSLRRPHGGVGVQYVASNILSRLKPPLMVYRDDKGEAMCYVITTHEDSTTLFCAHLDTVHNIDGPNPVIYDSEMQWASKADGLPLGADDAAGIWILYQMIEANVPGTYIFPVGEECGGIGSGWLAENAVDFLSKFDRAIAFDRKGTTSIITHQRGGRRCCSADFADALAKQLNHHTQEQFGTFIKDDGGVFTDTANFMEIIPECTNISAGYTKEHTKDESLDVAYLKTLCAAAIALDWNALPAVRDPAVEDCLYDKWESYGSYRGDSYVGGYVGKGWAADYGMEKALELEDLYSMKEGDIYDLVFENPEGVAEMLVELIHGDKQMLGSANDLKYEKEVWEFDDEYSFKQ